MERAGDESARIVRIQDPAGKARTFTGDGRATGEVTPQVRLLRVISGEMTSQQLRQALDLKDNKYFRRTYLLPALHTGLIEMAIPDKPRSSK